MFVRYIHWKESEAAERAGILVEAGYRVDHRPTRGLSDIIPRDGAQPDAVVIDLSRQPANGRIIAYELRKSRRGRHVPLVFVDGAEEKVARLKTEVPDGLFVAWAALPAGVARAIDSPPEIETSPARRDDIWAHRPLIQKLGITEGSRISLIGAPDGFEDLLGDLPEGAVIRHGASPRADITIWFVETSAELEGRIVGYAELARTGRLWIAWPKKSSRMASDLTMYVVREAANAADLSDYKILSVDDVWSAMVFAPRAARTR